MKLPRPYGRGIFSLRFVGSGIPPKRKHLRFHPWAYAPGVSRKRDKTEKYIRPTWDEYFMEIIEIPFPNGQTCDRGRASSVFVKDKGDTLILERYKYLYKNRIVKDSIFINDTIRVSCPVEVIKQVKVQLTSWQNFQIWCGRLALFVLFVNLHLFRVEVEINTIRFTAPLNPARKYGIWCS